MRKSITRTLITSTIYGYELIVENGSPISKTLEPVKVVGKVNMIGALKELKSEYGKDKALSVAKIETNEAIYEISVKDFIENAKVVSAKNNEKVGME